MKSIICFFLGHDVIGHLDSEGESYVECRRCYKRAQALRWSKLWRRRRITQILQREEISEF
jgi:hypothetical protein